MVDFKSFQVQWLLLKKYKVKVFGCVFIAIAIWAVLNPKEFVQAWVTPDQLGQIYFNQGNYKKAALSYETPFWKGVSHYAAEEFELAEKYFVQYQDENGLLARGNALAHSRNYIPAKAVYQELHQRFPNHPAPAINLPIIQKIIDENRRLSESQLAENGDLASGDESAGPESSEGDERVAFTLSDESQLNADELLQNPALTEMWMRQVQKNPARFLKIKFYMQLEQAEKSGGTEE